MLEISLLFLETAGTTIQCTTMIVIYFSKDARLPVQLQRAMAKEAEAARDARAKVSPENLLKGLSRIFFKLLLLSKPLIFPEK